MALLTRDGANPIPMKYDLKSTPDELATSCNQTARRRQQTHQMQIPPQFSLIISFSAKFYIIIYCTTNSCATMGMWSWTASDSNVCFNLKLIYTNVAEIDKIWFRIATESTYLPSTRHIMRWQIIIYILILWNDSNIIF